jgi:hypothetical protein
VIRQAADRGLPVPLSVVVANALARTCYEREGFEVGAIEPPFFRKRRGPPGRRHVADPDRPALGQRSGLWAGADSSSGARGRLPNGLSGVILAMLSISSTSATPSQPTDPTGASTTAPVRPTPSVTTAIQDTVQISQAGQSALQEASETAAQTAQEAQHGDRQAQRLLAREAAERAQFK